MHTHLVARRLSVDKYFRQWNDDAVAKDDVEAGGALHRVVEAVRRTTAVDGAPTDGEARADAAAETVEALAALHRLRDQLDAWEPVLIEAARAQGASWAGLAPALGVTTRQAAERRYLRLRPARDAAKDAALTREERVREARDQRAGDRAVAAWARENASELRQIAGQVSSLAGLGSAATRDAEVLASSLTGDDPSLLIEPLADMHVHLADEHVALAAKVEAVGRNVGKVRRDTQRRRDATQG
jgi:hypothetical protein